MSIGDPISQPIPSVGTTGTGYASQLVDLLTEFKNRLVAKVPVGSILAGLFDMANNAIANLSYVGLYEQTTVPSTPVGALQRYGGNLYYVSPSGAVRLTNGATLDAASVKGFTGDYGYPNPAGAKFVDIDQRYSFYDDEAASALGYVRGLGFDIAPSGTSANRVRLAWAGSADYTLTVPAAPPAAQKMLQMDAAGAVSASNVMATNQDIEVSGTGMLKTGDRHAYIQVTSGSGYCVGGSFTIPSGTPGLQIPTSATGFFLFGLPYGARMKSVRVLLASTPGSAVTLAGGTAVFQPRPVTLTARASTSSGVSSDTPILTITTPRGAETPSGSTSTGEVSYYVSVGIGAVSASTVMGLVVTYDIQEA